MYTYVCLAAKCTKIKQQFEPIYPPIHVINKNEQQKRKEILKTKFLTFLCYIPIATIFQMKVIYTTLKEERELVKFGKFKFSLCLIIIFLRGFSRKLISNLTKKNLQRKFTFGLQFASQQCCNLKAIFGIFYSFEIYKLFTHHFHC